MNKQFTGLLFIILILANAGLKAETTAHSFFKGGWATKALAIIDKKGNVEWEMKSKDEMSDAWALPDGGIVFRFSRRKQDEAGVVRLDSNKNKAWEYRVPKGRDNHSCQPLPHRGFLLGVNSKEGSWMVEIDENGKLIKEIKLELEIKDYHHAFRHVRKTPEGTYLGTIMKENRAYEWDASGKLIRTFPTGHFTAIRLPNHNTITSGKPSKTTGKGGFVTEYSPEGKIIWALTKEDLEKLGIRLGMVCGFHCLPNGNIVISNVKHGKGTKKGTPYQAFEITRDKKLVWTVLDENLYNMGSIQILDIEGDVYKGEVIK